MKKIVLAIVLVLAATAAPATATDKGFYIGGSIGGSSLDINDFDTDLGDLSFSDGDTTYKIFAGYRILDFLAVEAGYVDFGNPSDTVGTVEDDPIKVDIGLTGWDAFALGILPIGPVDVFAKIGLISWDADILATLGDLVDADSDSGTDVAYGLGVALRLGSFAVRIEGELFDVDGADDLYMLSAGATFTF
ncbi:MAG: outer membrane beta-barrel protein [Acidobacteriota bacterium]|nr:outer membrane beta-barrel protein [Acidobacteriota bacterium]